MYLCISLFEKLVLDLLRRVHLYFVVICSLMRAFANRRRGGTLDSCRMLISSSYVNFYRSERPVPALESDGVHMKRQGTNAVACFNEW